MEGSPKDPVCGAHVHPPSPNLLFNNKTYYFCSEGCRRKFDANPHDFIPLQS